MSGFDVRLVTHLHPSEPDPDAATHDGWGLLGALAGPRLYLSAGRRFRAALDRAFYDVWFGEGPTQARRLVDAGWTGWAGVATSLHDHGPRVVEAVALSPAVVVGLIPMTFHDGPLDELYADITNVLGVVPSTETVFCRGLR